MMLSNVLCSDLQVTISLSVILSVMVIVSQSYPCEESASVNGSVYYRSDLQNGNVKSSKETIFTKDSIIRHCMCLKKPCIQKCCNNGYSVDKNGLCSLSTKQFQIEDLDFYNYSDLSTQLKPNDHHFEMIYLLMNDTNCKNHEIISKSDKYDILKNGSLLLHSQNKSSIIDTDKYCIEWNQEFNRIVPIMCSLNANKQNKTKILIKHGIKLQSANEFIQSNHTNIKTRSIVYRVCMIISMPFLILTYIVTGKRKRKTIRNKYVKCLVGNTFVMFIIQIIITTYIKNEMNPACIFLGYAAHVTLLANFFWLNAMCYDIWQVFSGRSLRARSMTKYQEWRKFMKYCLYAWGCPVIICTATFIADLVLPDGNRYKPMVGVKYCIINDNKSKMLFYFFPLILLLLLNVIMFSSTALKLFKHKKQTNVLRTGENQINNSAEKERLNLYFKLFLVMGITWVTEPISWIFNEKPSILWIICDCINLLQGIPIFIIFVCKKRYLEAVKSKLFSSYRRESTATSPYSTATTSTSQPSTRNDSKAGLNSTRNASQELEMIPDDKSISNISEEN
ncbi:G-protein coupled receptor Mth-like isoform X1 [Lycorma delicatula]|uniref:G-protein coupled receptor Mth-like isoform X1 n=1 Tax=Lycorma delicatula TaxID=130591 RepID=UPI003F518917